MPVTVYDHPLSPYGQKVKIALLEKGVEFAAPLPVAIGSGAAEGEFSAASPRGEVPALVDGDVAVFDSTVILEYIEDRWPEPALLPPQAAERARVRMVKTGGLAVVEDGIAKGNIRFIEPFSAGSSS